MILSGTSPNHIPQPKSLALVVKAATLAKEPIPSIMSACTQMLKYRPQSRHDEGPRIFTGHPADFKLWEFHTQLKAQLARSEESKAPKYVTEVMKGLGGEALQLARDIGVEELCKKNGIDELIAKMQKLVFPTVKQEASELYQIGHEMQLLSGRWQHWCEP